MSQGTIERLLCGLRSALNPSEPEARLVHKYAEEGVFAHASMSPGRGITTGGALEILTDKFDSLVHSI